MSRPRDITSRDTCAVTSPRYVTTTRTRRAPSTPPASRPRDAGRSRPLRRHVPPQHGDVHDVTSRDRDAGGHVLCAVTSRPNMGTCTTSRHVTAMQGGHVLYAVTSRHQQANLHGLQGACVPVRAGSESDSDPAVPSPDAFRAVTSPTPSRRATQMAERWAKGEGRESRGGAVE